METIKRTKIVDVLQSTAYGSTVNVKGWVRTRRGSKQVSFIALNDGSTINNVQVVVDVEKFGDAYLKPITTGASLSVNGTLVQSQGKGQSVEIQATEIEIYGTADPMTYPLQKKGHSMEFLREIAHLRPRTNTFGAVFRIRHNMAYAIHKFFHDKGFFYFHTPIITASDCEGAGQMFQVTTLNLYDLKKDEKGSIIYDNDFFGKQASLTVSGQLEGELAATALGQIYTFGPTFRAENSNTPRHLAEFWMIEPEVAFNDILDNMELAEEFIKYCVQWALDNCKDDIKFLNDMFDKELISRLEGVLKDSFVRLPYTEGIKILEEAVAKGHQFEFPVYWGVDLASEHERYLVEEQIDLAALQAEQEAAAMAAVANATSEESALPYIASPAGVVFVGDSRCVQMSAAVGGGGSTWICENSKRYSWFETNAVPKLDDIVGKGTKVVICMGVNDPGNYKQYAALTNQRAAQWAARGAKTYFVSVNPVWENPYVTQEQVDTFNANMPGLLNGVRWIDTASIVKQGGYKLVDGLHYDTNAYINIFNLICGSL